MEKLKQFLYLSVVLLEFVLYPVISFNWYRFCRAKGDNDAMRFVGYGILGIVGILGLVAMRFTSLPWNGLVGILAGVPYLLGSKLQIDLIVRKKRASFGS